MLISIVYFFGHSFQTLRLQDGRPELVYSQDQKVITIDNGIDAFNDGLYHHIAMVMPHESCRLSEIKMFVDGNRVGTAVLGDDDIIYLPKILNLY